MWFEDAPDRRTGRSRVAEALATGAKTLAVSCPFCLTMAADGIAARGSDMAVRDMAEILADALPSKDRPCFTSSESSHGFRPDS
jgi:Fe-S oxidoreductase